MGVRDRDRRVALSIRLARREDYREIVEVWHRSGLPTRLQGRESVAVAGERVVGVVLGTHDHRKGWINRLAVLPEYRRHGVAMALVTACEKALHAGGIEIIAALIEPENAVSCAFFERMGYRNDLPARYYRKLARPDI